MHQLPLRITGNHVYELTPLHVSQSRTCSYVTDANTAAESRNFLPCEIELMHHVSNSWQILKWEKNSDVSLVITSHVFLLNKRFWMGQHAPSPFKESYFTLSHSFPTIFITICNILRWLSIVSWRPNVISCDAGKIIYVFVIQIQSKWNGFPLCYDTPFQQVWR